MEIEEYEEGIPNTLRYSLSGDSSAVHTLRDTAERANQKDGITAITAWTAEPEVIHSSQGVYLKTYVMVLQSSSTQQTCWKTSERGGCATAQLRRDAPTAHEAEPQTGRVIVSRPAPIHFSFDSSFWIQNIRKFPNATGEVFKCLVCLQRRTINPVIPFNYLDCGALWACKVSRLKRFYVGEFTKLVK